MLNDFIVCIKDPSNLHNLSELSNASEDIVLEKNGDLANGHLSYNEGTIDSVDGDGLLWTKVKNGHGHQHSLESGYHSSTQLLDDDVSQDHLLRRSKRKRTKKQKIDKTLVPQRDEELISTEDIERMLLETSAEKVHRRVDVKKENEDVAVMSILDNFVDGPDGPQSLFDVDLISENMDIAFVDEKVTVISTVRCDRTTPIPGYDYVRHRSSVIVNKITEFDMAGSEERLRLYRLLQQASLNAEPLVDGSNESAATANEEAAKFIDPETLQMYHALLVLANINNKNVTAKRTTQASHSTFSAVRKTSTNEHCIDSDFEYDPEALEKQLDETIANYHSEHLLPSTDEDNIDSYVNTASAQLDILY